MAAKEKPAVAEAPSAAPQSEETVAALKTKRPGVWRAIWRFCSAPFRFVIATFGVVVGGGIMVLAASTAVLTLGLAAAGLLTGVILAIAGIIAFVVIGLGCAIIFFLVGLLVIAMVDRMIGTTLVTNVTDKIKESVS